MRINKRMLEGMAGRRMGALLSAKEEPSMIIRQGIEGKSSHGVLTIKWRGRASDVPWIVRLVWHRGERNGCHVETSGPSLLYLIEMVEQGEDLTLLTNKARREMHRGSIWK